MLQFAALFVFGLVIGSFIAALSYRLPRGISIKRGRSFCPNCKNKISWFDNIPVVSYLILGGKCRSCKKRISSRYPLIELSTAFIFVLVGQSPFILFISSILIAVFIIDWEQMIIPDELVFIGLAATFLYKLGGSDLYLSLLTGFACAVFLLLIHLITLGKGMGLGDVKLAILTGTVLGPHLSPIFLLASFLTGGVVAAILLVTGRARLKQKIAFGPFLVAGFFIAQLFGRNISWFVSQTLQFRFF